MCFLVKSEHKFDTCSVAKLNCHLMIKNNQCVNSLSFSLGFLWHFLGIGYLEIATVSDLLQVLHMDNHISPLVRIKFQKNIFTTSNGF